MRTLRETSLSPTERRVLERAVQSLRDELGESLRGVWLYGSRARGEPGRDEDSDVDLLVVTDRGEPDQKMARELLHRAAEAEGANPWAFHAIAETPNWVAERRSIEAFLLKEIDRDKVVLAGSGGEDWWQPPSEGNGAAVGVRHRTREYLDEARQKLAAAQLVLGKHEPSAVSLAYYAAFEAARAALSEADRFARTHPGTWHLFHETFVATGRFEPELSARVRGYEEARINADYNWWRPEPGVAEEIVRDAERFLEAVERMIEPS